MARYSSNFGNKLQLMVGIGKEYGFMSNFKMPWPFAPRKTELPRNGEHPIRLPNGLLYPRVEEEQRLHSGDDIVDTITLYPFAYFLIKIQGKTTLTMQKRA